MAQLCHRISQLWYSCDKANAIAVTSICHQVYINVDHSKQSGFQPKISTSSNFQNNHRVSQVIEPVVNTITDAIKKGFTDYNSHKQYGNTACQVPKGRIPNLLDFWL